MKNIRKNRVFWVLLLTSCATAFLHGMAQEDHPWTPVMLSVITPLQVPSSGYKVRGLKLDILYGVCHELDGLSIGLASRATGHVNGLQAAALVSLINGDGIGVQIAPVACVIGRYAGVQVSIANFTRHANGLQLGIYNGAGHIDGCQIGLINVAQTLHGVQIGLVNVLRDRGVPFLPFFNCYF